MNKKTLLKIILSISLILGISSCTTKVDYNGLSNDIKNILPDSILNEMIDMGMPIFGGNKPPKLEGTYNVSPFILDSSNVAGDYSGQKFADFVVTFHDFNARKLTVEIDYENGLESGTGIGSYIVGENNNFSVFCEIKATQLIVFKAEAVIVLTGTITDEGINNLIYANFMVDNHGNEEELWIENGEGRIIYDSDGFSERTDVSKTFNNKTDKSALSK